MKSELDSSSLKCYLLGVGDDSPEESEAIMDSKTLRTIAKAAYPTWKGRKLHADFSGKVTFSDTNWGGGSRNYYVSLSSDGRKRGLMVPAPWVNPIEGQTVQIPEGFVVVEHTIFCGKDCGVTIHFPMSAAALPAPSLPVGV